MYLHTIQHPKGSFDYYANSPSLATRVVTKNGLWMLAKLPAAKQGHVPITTADSNVGSYVGQKQSWAVLNFFLQNRKLKKTPPKDQ